MNELDEIYELESEEENVPTTTIQTQHGPVEVPIDENWHEYTEDERRQIRDFICANIDLCVDTREYFIDDRVSARGIIRIESFEDAKKASDGVAVLEGDYGSQIYLICPMKYVKCSKETLNDLLCIIDALEWISNDGDGTSLEYRRAKTGDEFISGAGSKGIIEDGLWIHGEISSAKTELIRKVINGELDSIN